LYDKNPWQFVNANDQGIGFPRDSAPKNHTSFQWTKLNGAGVKDYKYTVLFYSSSIDKSNEIKEDQKTERKTLEAIDHRPLQNEI
jgi:hypothetical protein